MHFWTFMVLATFIATNGNAAYISRCPAIDVARADFENCTQEVPVSVNGSLRFADPFTWILQDFPTIVPCSALMPVRWKIEEVMVLCLTQRPSMQRPLPTEFDYDALHLAW